MRRKVGFGVAPESIMGERSFWLIRMNNAQRWVVLAKDRALPAPPHGFVFEVVGARFKGFGKAIEECVADDEREDDKDKTDAEQQEVFKVVVESVQRAGQNKRERK
ncbi:MAG: hypothetical protein H0T92_04510 [Pyrinomonadaceae bacterium]|nr:hypothetical protein [Pyrinomonadaceae bacterium]